MNRRSSWTTRGTAVVAVVVSIALLPTEGFGRDLRPADAQVPSNSTPYRGDTYNATGTATDAADARTAVDAVGIGKKIDLTERGAKSVRAEIYAIAPDHFTVKIGRSMRDVAYRDVVRLKRAGMPKELKIGLIAAASAIAAAMLIDLLIWSGESYGSCFPLRLHPC